MPDLFFDGWPGVVRTLLVGALAYVTLVAVLRVSGKRTLAKLNAFDLVVTVALGSILATVLLSKDVDWAEGAAAMALLIGLQLVVSWLSVRVGWVRRAVRSEPTLLLRRGRFLERAMDGERVTEGEVLAAVRSAGIATVDEVEAVVLETDGSLSVLRRPSDGAEATSLRDVPGADG
jgi:uncharacterized membrane protein YcaP (DUF421 family)